MFYNVNFLERMPKNPKRLHRKIEREIAEMDMLINFLQQLIAELDQYCNFQNL